jgi:lon-related putative ATP-dependent protease
MDINSLEVQASALRVVCDPKVFKFETTAALAGLPGIIGQKRAVEALEFGLRIATRGFNIYASGVPGTGRNYTITAHVKSLAVGQPAPSDWCYVYSFDDPDRPRAIRLAPSKAPEFARDMDDLIVQSRQAIASAFGSENYDRRREEALSGINRERAAAIQQIEGVARREGFAVQPTPVGVVTVPLRNGEPMSQEEFEKLSDAEKSSLRERGEQLRARLEETVAHVRTLEREGEAQLRELDREIGLFAIGHLFKPMGEKYADHDEIQDYLKQAQADIIDNLDQFRRGDAEPEQRQLPLPVAREQVERSFFRRYSVNVLVTHGSSEGAPVVVEHNPTYYNLFGKLEYRAFFGGMQTDFTLIKPGALHLANGGYLILQARELLLAFLAWDALKRVLRSGELTIENIGEHYTPIPAVTLRPEPIPLNVKVVLVGHPLLYYLLNALDEDFAKLFKVRADFDVEMSRGDCEVDNYGAFAAAWCRDQGLRHLTSAAVARLVEYGSRLAGDQQKLSTRFILISDVISEADYWAGRTGAGLIDPEHINRALEEKEYRSKRIEEKVLEMLERGDILVDVEGSTVGQCNGLSISDLGDHVFGRPSRITARTRMGRGDVLNIEREADLGGNIYNKAVLILSSYLAARYLPDAPLSLHASLCFEQSYEGVEGDSASVAEVCAVISSLAEAPLRQDLAVTGSLNQHGQVQPVGGVTRKVEGFYAVCKAKGLTGTQGVVLPAQNVKNLALKDEVVEAVGQGKFHIYAVRTADEALALLTGMEPGERGADGTYPPDSINGRAEANLRHFAESARDWGLQAQAAPTPAPRRASKTDPHRSEGSKDPGKGS